MNERKSIPLTSRRLGILASFIPLSTPILHADVISTANAGSWSDGTTWIGGVVPGEGDTADINHGTIDHNESDGYSEPTDLINLNAGGILRVQRSHIYENVNLNGGQLHVWNDGDTVTIGTLTINGGQIRDRNNRENNGVAASSIVGSADFSWYNWANSGTVAQAFFIDCPDMTGYTGTITVGAPGRVGFIDLRQDIPPSDASFGMNILGASNIFVLSGHVAVVSLTVNGDSLDLGTYTLDTVSNPGAIDLSNVNGVDYSALFEDAGGTITVASPGGQPLPDLRITSLESNGADLIFTWDSQEGKVYDLLSSTDPEADGDPNTWAVVANQEGIVADPPTNTLTIARPLDATRLYVIREEDAPPPPPPPPAFFDDFESVPNPDWTTGASGGDAGTTVWERGAPLNVGPTSGYDGSATCFGTNISADYTLGTDIWLRTPPIDLTGEGLTGATLSFFQHRDTDLDGEVDDDYGTIRVLDANSLAQLGGDIVSDVEGFDFDGENNPIWLEFEAMALPAEALGKEVVIEFRFKSDDLAATFAGWYIDNVTVDVTNN